MPYHSSYIAAHFFTCDHQDQLIKTEREQHTREVASLTETRDQLQEKLREREEREEGEGEEVAGGSGGGGERSRELLEQLGRVEEMNRKTSARLRQTKEKTKVSCDS